jgi:simple sugar transport system permease protein
VSDFFTQAVLVATFASGIRLAVPLLLASLGETFGQRSGVLNLGVDGIMLLGAFGGYYTVLKTDNVWLGLAMGIGVGLLLGLLSAVISVTLKAEQGISGIGVYLFGLGMSDLLFQKLVGTPVPISKFPKIDIPGLSDIPILGEMLADSLGVSVAGIRYATVIIGGTLAGVAGAALAIDLGIFQQNLTNAQGFIAIALVYFGAWRPVGVMAGALLYGLINSLVLQLKTLDIITRDFSDFAAMAPAIITILALVLVARRFRQPAALTKPYSRGA